jgi:hypothetical protein
LKGLHKLDTHMLGESEEKGVVIFGCSLHVIKWEIEVAACIR